MNTHPTSLTRRNFIAHSGLAAAAVSMPHIARAQNDGGSKLRIGIIGRGGRSNRIDGRSGITLPYQ